MTQQLDLFSVLPPASIFVFPIARRADLVRSVSSELLRLDYHAGKRLWNSTCRSLRSDLKASGLSVEEVRLQISDFSIAVQAEMSGRTSGKRIG